MTLPIVRGWMSTPPANWMTVGCGRLVKKAIKAQSLSKEGSSQELDDLLGKEFISFATTTRSLFFFYACPRCEGDI